MHIKTGVGVVECIADCELLNMDSPRDLFLPDQRDSMQKDKLENGAKEESASKSSENEKGTNANKAKPKLRTYVTYKNNLQVIMLNILLIDMIILLLPNLKVVFYSFI